MSNISAHLPWNASSMLMKAAKTPITKDDPMARVKAIEQAILLLKLHYPNYFRQDE